MEKMCYRKSSGEWYWELRVDGWLAAFGTAIDEFSAESNMYCAATSLHRMGDKRLKESGTNWKEEGF